MTGAGKALIVFGRYPVLGQVKTRLTPFLTPQQALDLHQALLADTLWRTASLGAQQFLFLGDCTPAQARRLAAGGGYPGSLEVHIQSGANLGRRLAQAERQIRARHQRIVFVGTDSPTLPLSFLEQAFRALQRYPCVIGPVEDGGYYLLGLSRSMPQLLEGIQWGSPQVFEQTLARLREGDYHLLPPWYDVDLPEDLRRLATELLENPSQPAAATARLLQHWSQTGGPRF